MMRSRGRRRFLPLLLAVPPGVLACAAGAAPPPEIRVEDAWARPSPYAGAPSAVFATVRNTGDRPDRLLGADSDAADAAELHRSTLEDGIMRMRPVQAAEVPAGGELRLEPGGYHIMLLGVREPLAPGDTVALTFRFEHAGAVEVRAPVEARMAH